MDLKHCMDLKHTYIPKGIDKVSFVYIKQGVQGLQAFDLCVVTSNDEHVKPRFKRKLKS